MLSIPLWRVFAVFAVCLWGCLFSLPTFISDSTLKKLPDWMPKERVSLGLDLQGGSHLLLEVDVKSGFKDRLAMTLDDVRKQLRKDKILYSSLLMHGDSIVFKLKEIADKEKTISSLKRLDSHFAIDIQDDGRVTVGFDEASRRDIEDKLLSQSLEIVERRINEIGTKEPNIQRQGTNLIIVQLPGVQDPAHVKNLLGQTAKMSFRFLHKDMPYAASHDESIPFGAERLVGEERENATRQILYNVDKQILLTGEHLIDAQVSFGERGDAKVHFRFDTIGARKFADITRNGVGRALAIVLDGKVLTAPNINGPIPGGSGEITGNFTPQSATDLAILMRAGALPAPIKVVEERTVGPDLGADSVDAGQRATVISVVLVAIFMVLAYALFGIFSVFALIFNLILLVAVLAITGSTLTLPGIAGIALTMGMAVDANVLIYERIKEELRNGKKIAIAINSGYTRAMATILDSNITTLIGAAALYFWGSGPIKGFGVTLSFGIVISMFTAISLTKIFAVYWINWRKPKVLSI